MMFSSKMPRDLNHDPKPWVGVDGSRKSRYSRFAPRKDPRPEFDHVQYNAPNIILVVRRVVGPVNIYWEDLWRWPTQDEIEHARKVMQRLHRLRALTGENDAT